MISEKVDGMARKIGLVKKKTPQTGLFSVTVTDKDKDKVPETPGIWYNFEILITHSLQIW